MRLRRTLSASFALALLAQVLVVSTAFAQDFEAEMVNLEFVPTEIFIEPGDTVTWQNRDPAIHTVTRLDDGTRLGVALPGESTSVTFEEEGVHELFCELHPEMRVDVIAGAPPELGPATRLEAPDRVGTAIAWSQERYEDGDAPFALLGRDDVFADSLASGGAQAALDGPLLLTPQGSLDGRTLTELQRLGTASVYVLGGSAAISDSVLAALRSAGISARRVSGADRIDTSVAVAERFFPRARTAILARAFAGTDATQAFADSLAAGALSARLGVPIVLSASDRLSASTRRYLDEQGVTDVIVAGGTGALSAQVEADLEALDITVDRAGGTGRVETAAELALRGMEAEDAPDGVVYVDAGKADAWADGFAAAAHRMPVLLTSDGDVPARTLAFQLAAFQFSGRICGTSVDEPACDRLDLAATAPVGSTTLVAVTTGGEEVPPTGVEASGFADIAPAEDPGTLCFNWAVFGLEEEVTGAHIHVGAPGTNGDIVVDLAGSSAAVFDPSDRYGCAFGLEPELVEDIVANPGGYYVNVHTPTHPAGAIRGQLFTPTGMLVADLIGDAVLPGPGSPGGVGVTFMLVDGAGERLCALAFVEGLGSAVTGAGIHQRGEGDVGPAVIDLPAPGEGGMPGLGCVTDPDLADVLANPEGYYVQVTTAEHPQGALRGDLIDLFALEGPLGPGGDDEEADLRGFSELRRLAG